MGNRFAWNDKKKVYKYVKDKLRLVVICSATESVKLSWLVKKVFTALRYLNEGSPIIPEVEIPMPDTINETKTIMQLRIFVRSLLNFIINPEIIMKSVGSRSANPA